ncbi:hypothetical protein BASA81_013768 [Batrachochytrium salamandrivorans]|nr:hypothetical protein BASA81_013768 [Batrachochytrium salamandrivorans]
MNSDRNKWILLVLVGMVGLWLSSFDRKQPLPLQEEQPVIYIQQPTPTAKPVACPLPPHPLRDRLLRRLEEFKQEHIANNQSHAIGLRGVSWIHRHLNGALIASPNVAESLLNTDAQGWATVRFVDVSEKQQCPPEMANLVSIYVRFSGPELMAVVAEPVLGKCEWKAKVQFTIPGEYTVLARLLHYNGKLDITEDCELQTDLAQVRFKLMHKIPRYPYYVNDPDCRKMCTRYEHCTHSMGFTSDGNPCYLFTESNNSDSFLASEVFTKYNESETKLQVGLCRKTIPFTKQEWVWQLGCGRDEMLLRWASCAGLNQTQTGRRMKAVEDMILFEFEHSNLAVPMLRSKTKLTLDQAQREFDSPVLPVCTLTQLAKHFDNGRWTRTPDWRVEDCGKLPIFDVYNWATSPTQLNSTDMMCNLRYELDTLNQQYSDSAYRSRFTYPYFEVWKTELSDTYFPPNPPVQYLGNKRWTGYFRLPPQAKCAFPPLISTKQLRQCVIDKNLEFHLHGDSIIEFFSHYFYAQINLAFPERVVDPHTKFPQVFTNPLPSKKSVKKVMVANFNVPNAMTYQQTDIIQRAFEGELKVYNSSQMHHKVFLTSPFTIWERRNGLTAERMDLLANLMRQVLKKRGWEEVNLNRLSREWTMDSTPERDSLHTTAHSMVIAAQQFFHLVCA